MGIICAFDPSVKIVCQRASTNVAKPVSWKRKPAPAFNPNFVCELDSLPKSTICLDGGAMRTAAAAAS
jgi:hypothetical protein